MVQGAGDRPGFGPLGPGGLGSLKPCVTCAEVLMGRGTDGRRGRRPSVPAVHEPWVRSILGSEVLRAARPVIAAAARAGGAGEGSLPCGTSLMPECEPLRDRRCHRGGVGHRGDQLVAPTLGLRTWLSDALPCATRGVGQSLRHRDPLRPRVNDTNAPISCRAGIYMVYLGRSNRRDDI
jgi:hypothetical protein